MTGSSSSGIWFGWVLGIVGGILTTTVTTVLVPILFEPRLTFEVGAQEPFVVSAPGGSTWLRVRVRAGYFREAVGVRAYLADLKREGDPKPILQDDVILLPPSSFGDGDGSKAVTISRQFSRFFDFGCLPGPDDFRKK